MVKSVIAPWKCEQTGSSTVEMQQAQAAETYRYTTPELQSMTDQLAATQALVLSQQRAINEKATMLLKQMGCQPVHTALRSVRDSVVSLIDAGQMETARYIVRSIQTRLQKDPPLEYHFDMKEMMTRLQPLLGSCQSCGTPTTTRPEDGRKDVKDEEQEDKSKIEIQPDVMHL